MMFGKGGRGVEFVHADDYKHEFCRQKGRFGRKQLVVVAFIG